MSGSIEGSGGGVDHLVMADPHSERMKNIYGQLFNVCSDLVEVGLMEPEERERRMVEAQAHPAITRDYLQELDPSFAPAGGDVMGPQYDTE